MKTRRLSCQVDRSCNTGAVFAICLSAPDAMGAFSQEQATEGLLPAEIITRLSPPYLPAFDLKGDQFHLNFMHHSKIADRRALPWIMSGEGAATYRRGGRSSSRSNLSFSIGGGERHFLARHFGFRGEVRWSPTISAYP